MHLLRPTIWLSPGILIIYGASLDAAIHKHQAIQLVWTASGLCKFNNHEISGPLIINSQVEHQLHMEMGWVLLVEPKSQLGQQLVERLAGADAVPIQLDSTIGMAMGKEKPKPEDDPAILLAPLINALGLKPIYSGGSPNVSDKRIGKLLNQLNSCLPGECLKPTGWKAADIAAQLAISEGRFLHLFKEQMGIPWRPYLLWYRLICAINALVKGSSVTEAAYSAGFSDSAHLSRTFRSLLGMSIRDSQSLFPKSLS